MSFLIWKKKKKKKKEPFFFLSRTLYIYIYIYIKTSYKEKVNHSSLTGNNWGFDINITT